jgi:hypothetical protein
MRPLLDWYYQLGFNLIPIPKGRKGAVVTWKQYEETMASKIPDEYDGNIAVVLGKTSGNLIDVDADSKDLLDLILNILPETMTTKSHRGGHFYYKTDFPIRKFTLDLGAYGKLEVAGQGQISILPPSIHPEGTVYEFIRKVEPAVWHGDIKQELTQLLQVQLGIKIKSEAINIEKILQGVPHGERDQSAIVVATYYRKKGLSEKEVADRLAEWNKRNQPPYGEHTSDNIPVDKWIQMKVESAFKPEKPYAYKFVESKKKTIPSPGQDLEDLAFEQLGDEYLVFNKQTQEITRQKKIEAEETYVPLEQIPWKPIVDVQPYDDIWSEVKQYLYEHIDIPSGYDILTAWVLATWIPEKWDAVPYLFFYGPAGSGKTWALEVLASISFRPFMSASTTLPVIFRACDMWHPTLFLDETEVYLRKERSEIMHLLNAGYRKGFPATRIEETDEGLKVKIFDCFGFKALAGTRAFVDTLRSRCIIFTMSKATREIKTKIDPNRAEELRKKLLMYRFRTLTEKQTLQEPNIVLTGRLRELFLPLVTVATAEAKGSIMSEAKKIEEITKEEEQTSDEATVFRAIVTAHEENPGATKISVERITQIVNEGLSYDEMFSNLNVGRIASRLGFKRAIHDKRRCVVWNENLVERLKKRWSVEEGQQQF